jgi:uncharacterized glyoxalase superfamily protein PhnB
MNIALTYVTIPVERVDQTSQFYSELFDVPTKFESRYQTTFIQFAHIKIALMHRDQWANHFGFLTPTNSETLLSLNLNSKDALQQLSEKALQKGCEICKPLSESPWGGYFVIIKDRFGIYWELFCPNPNLMATI